MIEIEGEYTTAKVMLDDVEENTIEQIQEMVNHESITNDVVIMPDTHVGSGSVIGFTMPLSNKVVPNIVGVDIGCFTGDTQVQLLDGKDYDIENLAERDEKFAVYSVDEKTGKVDVSWASARKTRKNSDLVRVILDNGEQIECTPDHRFLLRDGEYNEAQNLSSGDSLMSLYKGETKDGYQLVYDNIQWIEYWHQVKQHSEETEYAVKNNYKVEQVEELGKKEDVYCLNVPEYGNFALSAGVFVHNCGMYGVNFGDTLPLDHEVRDEKIRNTIPFGFDVHCRNDYHMGKDFPWEQVSEMLAGFEAEQDFIPSDFDGFDGYGLEYFKNLCERIEYDKGRAINSMGTLGGGNHFIEIGKSVETGDYWCVIHSGSRGIGATIAEYWQEEAARLQDGRAGEIRDELSEYPDDYYKFDLDSVSDEDLLNWVQGGKGEDWKHMDAIVNDYKEDNPEKIEDIQGELVEISKIASEESQGNPLDYLEGEEAHGYIVDMIFAQRYASESRKKMARDIVDILDVEIKDSIESIHNFIDFRDGIIRKGATRSYEGERVIVPFNMRDGTLLIEGKSNPHWNYSVCHGAGRVMSRRQAHEELDVDEFKDTMNDVFSTSVNSKTLDEAPKAYKDTSVIEEAIEPTAHIIDRLEVIHNLKAE